MTGIKKVATSETSGAATFYLLILGCVKLFTEFNFLGLFVNFNRNDVERKHR